MSRKIRCFAAVLVLTLAAMPAGAAQARPYHLQAGNLGFLDSLWQWLTAHSAPGLTAIWEKEGGSMDPDGRTPRLPPPPPAADARGEMDPNGCG
ncbi:MAG TPA: hypothetical protein VF173_18685 [Thermoanaerobaculia bacterium]|nr:hypothetical protein [Thermoanaerobaculia bacterium]